MNDFKYVCFLSYFDHWLTEQEADNCQILSFDIAKDNEFLDVYMQGEKYFLYFYTTISDVAIDLKNNNKLKVTSESFRAIIINSLREKSLLKISYPKLGIVAEGGYDRTDVLFIPNDNILSQIQNLARKTGLFIIETMPYEWYQNDVECLSFNM